jgi:hypothetical protein
LDASKTKAIKCIMHIKVRYARGICKPFLLIIIITGEMKISNTHHENVICVWNLSSSPEQLTEVIKLVVK